MITSNVVNNVRIGTIVSDYKNAANYIKQIMHHGFESYQISFQPFDEFDFQKMADELGPLLEESGAVISSVFLGANPLGDTEDDKRALKSIETILTLLHG